MNTKDKELLLKDLCARLIYNVIVEYRGAKVNLTQYARSIKLEDCKPYLRPMSSMTREEHAYYVYYQSRLIDGILGTIGEYLDWLNKNMFDYSGLIERGLALEAPEGMYKIK